MADTQPTQAAGGGAHKGAPDGVNQVGGKTGGGSESTGGNYVDPGRGAEGGEGGFLGHGGQSHNDYSGTGDKDTPDVGNQNAPKE